jgi:flagellar biosynthesis protein FliR
VNTAIGLEPLLPALPAMLRAGGAAWIAPVFTSMSMPFRILLALWAAWIAMPLGLPAEAPASPWWRWAPLELLAGVCLGGVAAISVEALRLTGRVAAEQMGMTMGDQAEPSQEAEAGPVQAMMAWAAVIAFVSVGGVDAVVMGAVRAGSAEAWLASPDRLGGALDAAFNVGLRACMPVLAITLAGTVIGGAMVRAAPRMVTLGGGFGIRAAAGLGMLAASMATAWAIQQDLVRRSMDWLALGGSR